MTDEISMRWTKDWMNEPLLWRLRDLPDLSTVPGGDGIVITSHEAADTIEHLDAIIARFVAEIEQLRTVLSDIDALACNVDRPDEAVDYWVTGYADAMQKVKALLHRKKVRRD